MSLPLEWVAACFAELERKTPAKRCFSWWRPEGPDEGQLEESPMLRGVPQCRPRSSEVTTADQTPTKEPQQKL